MLLMMANSQYLVSKIYQLIIFTYILNINLNTYLAPTNEAFLAINDTINSLTDDELKEILLYHVIPNKITLSQLQNGSYKSASNNIEFTIEIIDDRLFIIDGQDNIYNITGSDKYAANSVIHEINGVLLLPITPTPSSEPINTNNKGLKGWEWALIIIAIVIISVIVIYVIIIQCKSRKKSNNKIRNESLLEYTNMNKTTTLN